MDRRDERQNREPYEKPIVRRVKLVKSELAATGCKLPASHMGPAVGCVRFGTCKMPGS